MSHYQSSAALQIQQEVHPASIGMLFKVFEQSEDQLYVAKLNQKLHAQCGEDFVLQFYAGDQLQNLPRSTLMSLARCYANVFNESWGEDWTTESALAEIESCINCDPDYLPIMSLLFHEDEVVGFSWGFIMDSSTLIDGSAPFSQSGLKRHESVQVAKYWMDHISNCDKLISIRELGVFKEYRNDKTPFLCLPIFNKAETQGCKVAFLRTKVTSKAFKLSLGIGLVPIQLFMVDGLLLMHGSVKYAAEIFSGMIDAAKKRRTQQNMFSNIKRYLCQY
jgi:hypothetical protein